MAVVLEDEVQDIGQHLPREIRPLRKPDPDPGVRHPTLAKLSLSAAGDIDKVAIVVDVREGNLLSSFPKVFATLRKMGYRGFLSVELFNRDYWKQDPLAVAKTGLAKTKAVAGV